MSDEVLNKLSPEHLAQLDDPQKAAFISMDEKDQDFFASSFKPAEISAVITRKMEIMQRNEATRARIAQVQAAMTQAVSQVPSTPAIDGAEGLLGAVGLGAGVAAGALISNDTGHWRGVKASDLVSALRSEFSNPTQTSLTVSGAPDAQITTVLVNSSKGFIPALTVNMTTVDDGIEVKMSDLSSASLTETLAEGGKKLINIAADGLKMMGKTGFHTPGEVIGAASHALDQSSDLGELAGQLKIKERAWKAMQASADSIEKNYLSELEKQRDEQYKNEQALHNYQYCAYCGKTFGDDELACTGCGQARPQKPANA